MRILILILLLFSLNIVSDTTNDYMPPKDPTYKELQQMELDLFDAIKNKDIDKLNDILSDDFTYLNPSNGTNTRSEFMKNIRDMSVEIKTIGAENLTVKAFGNSGIIAGIQKSLIVHEGNEMEVSVAFTDYFVRYDSTWYLKFAHGVDLEN